MYRLTVSQEVGRDDIVEVFSKDAVSYSSLLNYFEGLYPQRDVIESDYFLNNAAYESFIVGPVKMYMDVTCLDGIKHE